jgi:alpha-tubulin suppressor-like RCC1 family protein
MKRFYLFQFGIFLTIIAIIIACKSEVSEDSIPDTFPPAVKSFSPSNSATDVDISTNISVSFVEEIDTSTVTANLSDSNCSGRIQASKDNFATCVQMTSDLVVSNDDQTFTVQPASDLEGSTTYKIKISSGIKDAAGDNAMESEYTSTGFTTHETVPPVISSVCPPDGISNVDFSTSLKITFNEAIDTSSITTNTSDSSCIGCIQVSADDFSTCIQMSASPTSDENDTEFLLQPASDLSSGTTYKIRVTTDAKDGFGNAMASQYTNSSGFSTISGFSKVSGGAKHTCSVFGDDTVHCWGLGDYGRLGYGGISAQYTPVSVSGISTATQVSAGFYHSCAVLFDGTAICWGRGNYGQLGNGSTSFQNSPVSVSGITTASQVSAGESHTCAVLSDSTIMCWGRGGSGQLGNGSTSDQSTPVSVSGISTATQVSAGSNHSCAVLSDGTIECWGDGGSGQLGNGSTSDQSTSVSVSGISTATQVSAGYYHTCAVLGDSTIECWGYGGYGQLGNSSTSSESIPVSVTGVSTATQVSSGSYHNCAVLSDGSIKCWGNGNYGQLGNGSTSSQSSPVSVNGILSVTQISSGNYHNCAVLTSGTINCWGNGENGRLGNGSTSNQYTPIAVEYNPTGYHCSLSGDISDDFNDGSLDTTIWVENGLNGGILSESDGYLYFAPGTSFDKQVRTNKNLAEYGNFTLTLKMKATYVSGDKHQGFWLGNLAEGDAGDGLHKGYAFYFHGKTSGIYIGIVNYSTSVSLHDKYDTPNWSTDTWHSIRINKVGGTTRFYFDDQLIGTDNTYASGLSELYWVTGRSWKETKSGESATIYFDDFSVTDD